MIFLDGVHTAIIYIMRDELGKHNLVFKWPSLIFLEHTQIIVMDSRLHRVPLSMNYEHVFFGFEA